MAFIKTQITQEMVEKYDMKQDYLEIFNNYEDDFLTYGQEERFGKRKVCYDHLENLDKSAIITIDEQQDCYLRYGNCSSLIFGIIPHKYLCFYYKGQRIYLVVDFIEGARDFVNKTYTVECSVIQMNSLSTVNADELFLRLLEEALYIHYDEYYNSCGWKCTVSISFNFI